MQLIDLRLGDASEPVRQVLEIGGATIKAWIDDGHLRIGVDAPRSISIVRGEVLKPNAQSLLPPNAQSLTPFPKGGANALRNSIAARRRRTT